MSVYIGLETKSGYDGIHIASFLENKEQLLDRDEVVIPHLQASVEFDYPLQEAHMFQVHAKDEGITRGQLVDFICTQYETIYQEEDASSKTPVLTLKERMARGGLINRNTTGGIYGIWGHDIGDLCLSEIAYNPTTNIVKLSIES
jgi:hypothetical protein